MSAKGVWKDCPHCGNEKRGTALYRCKKCQGVYCRACCNWAFKCPHCGTVPFFSNVMGRIDPRAGPMRLDWRPKLPPDVPLAGQAGWSSEAAQGEPPEREKIEFPEWEAAPPAALKIGHERPYSGYTPENARRALERSNVDHTRPQDRDQAAHLARYVSWVLKDRAFDFIEDAARDEGLPMQVRAFYIHAAQLVGRT